MDKGRPPQVGHPLLDQLLIIFWPAVVLVNFFYTAETFANVAVGVGATLGGILTGLQIYSHLVGEPLSATILDLLTTESSRDDSHA